MTTWVVHWREGDATRWRWYQMQAHSESLVRDWVRELIRQGHFAYLAPHPTPLPTEFFVQRQRVVGGVYLRKES